MAKKKSARSGAKQTEESDGIDFEDALADVEQIVGKLESGDAGLGESLELYEAGVKRLKECHRLLGQAEQKISLLSGFDADGNAITEPFDEVADETLQQKQAARQRRRRAKSPKNATKGGESDNGDADDSSSTVDDSPGLF
tara:strand:- start:69300 stop:69722 length:423 start_codon:yes stop_codon:yes gene_type:complete